MSHHVFFVCKCSNCVARVLNVKELVVETELQGWLGMAVFLGEIWPCFWLPNPLSRKGGGEGGGFMVVKCSTSPDLWERGRNLSAAEIDSRVQPLFLTHIFLCNLLCASQGQIGLAYNFMP